MTRKKIIKYIFIFVFFISGITFADDHGNSTSTATNAGLNSSVAGRIETGGDNDYFRISVTDSGTLTVSSTGSFDTYGYLLNSSGSSIASDDDGGSGGNFRISRHVTSGTYYIRVRAYSSSRTGSYGLSIAFSGGGNSSGSSGGGNLLSAPTLLTPSNGSNNISSTLSTTFHWNSVNGATTYRIVVSQDSSFSGFVENGGSSYCQGGCWTEKTSSRHRSKNGFNLANHTYYWRVRAGNTNNSGAWSEVRSFTTAEARSGTPNFESSYYRTNSSGYWSRHYAPSSFYTSPNYSLLGSCTIRNSPYYGAVARGNCTWYAKARARELGATNIPTHTWRNAKDFATQARADGFTVNSTPTVGAIAQHTRGTYGHVAVVEQVNSNGTILISESSYAPCYCTNASNASCWNFLYRTRQVARSYFSNYIHVEQ